MNMMNIPLEEEQVEVVVLLGEEVAKDSGGVATSDLVRRQPEVDTLDKVPQQSWDVIVETPVRQKYQMTFINTIHYNVPQAE